MILCGCTHEITPTFPNTYKGNFEALWQIIDEKYCYLDAKNINWDSIHDVYQAKVAAMETNDYRFFFNLMGEMLDNLRDGHVNMYSDFDVYACTNWYDSYPTNYSSELIVKHYIPNYKAAGGFYYDTIANGQVGYMLYTSFQNGFSNKNLGYIFDYFKNCKGIILDVRNNGGGSLEYAKKMAAIFFENNETVAFRQHKIGSGHEDFSKLEEMNIDTNDVHYHWHKPVVILCNRKSYSATNFFVSSMRYTSNCTIIGGITGGGGGMPVSYEMPNGWMIRFSSIRMLDRNKNSIEDGIEPDIKIDLTSNDKDDIIEKAIEIVNQKAL